MEFADKLRHIDRNGLIERIKKVYASIGMRLPTLEHGGDMNQPIDERTARMWVQRMDGCEHFPMQHTG